MPRIRWLIITGLVAAGLIYGLRVQQSLEEKRAWAALQSVQARQPPVAPGSFRLVDDASLGGFTVLGMAAEQDPSLTVWVLLNEGDEDGPVKALPQALSPLISCQDLERVKARTAVDSKVSRQLEARCSQ